MLRLRFVEVCFARDIGTLLYGGKTECLAIVISYDETGLCLVSEPGRREVTAVKSRAQISSLGPQPLAEDAGAHVMVGQFFGKQ
jgi:hypothetical protein